MICARRSTPGGEDLLQSSRRAMLNFLIPKPTGLSDYVIPNDANPDQGENVFSKSNVFSKCNVFSKWHVIPNHANPDQGTNSQKVMYMVNLFSKNPVYGGFIQKTHQH